MKQLNWYQIFGNTHIIPDGKTVTPTDDIQTLLHCANIWDKSYTTLAEVLADDDTLFLICISNNAIDYLVRSTSWAVAPALVPKMTSATTPSGVVSASSYYGSYEPYKAFDEDLDTAWYVVATGGGWVEYRFPNEIIPTYFYCYLVGASSTPYTYTTTVQVYVNDAWVTVGSHTTGSIAATPVEFNLNLSNNSKTTRVRVHSVKSDNVTSAAIHELQFYSPSIPNSESAMQYIGASDYASETLLSDSTWLTAIDGSAYKSYIENINVPTMTDSTHPSGEVSATSYTGSQYPYLAFDGNDSTYWRCNPSDRPNFSRLQYKFPYACKVFKVYSKERQEIDTSVKVQGSNDGVTWSDVSGTYTADSGNSRVIDELFTNDNYYQHYGLWGKTLADETRDRTIYTAQFVGRIIGGVQSWLKAGGVEGKKYTTVSEVLSDLTTLAALMSSTDAIDYLVTAKGWATEICSDSNAMADIGMNNYAANTLLADETWAEAIGNSTYFESVLNVKVPAMTSNTTPYGECFGSTPINSSYPYWKAFDGDDNTCASLTSTPSSSFVGYKFVSAVKIVAFDFLVKGSGSWTVSPIQISYSDDGVTYTDVSKTFSGTNNVKVHGTFGLHGSHQYWKANRTTSTARQDIAHTVQFYGRKDI